MIAHLRKWYLAYGAGAIGVLHDVWPPLREYVCSHPKVSGAGLLLIVAAALMKESPLVNGAPKS
jgi:hypothetical protein